MMMRHRIRFGHWPVLECLLQEGWRVAAKTATGLLRERKLDKNTRLFAPVKRGNAALASNRLAPEGKKR
ncbi:hypothetical protein GL279_00780 [Paracoccus limosus]|uniref:Uncharacterized protein n=1 Tax=Paracoccus limosus TaxID=913252 RepID=A0A844H106_9RHOB|nr:hypothetical protein [Paracoccus limosus]